MGDRQSNQVWFNFLASWLHVDDKSIATTWQGFIVLDYSLEDYKNCLDYGLKIGVNIEGVYVSGGFQGGSCDGLLNEMGGEVPHFIKYTAVCRICSVWYQTHELMLKLWSHSVSLQRTQRMAAWWRTLLLLWGVEVVNPSLLWCLKSFPPRSWWGCGARAYDLTLTSFAQQWVSLSFTKFCDFSHLSIFVCVHVVYKSPVHSAQINMSLISSFIVHHLICYNKSVYCEFDLTNWCRNIFKRVVVPALAQLQRGKVQLRWSILNRKICQIAAVPNTTRPPCSNTVKFQHLWCFPDGSI